MFLSMMPLASAFIKTRNPPPTQKRALFRLQDFKDVHYMICCLCFFVGYLGLYVFYYYIQLYAIDVTHTDSNLAFYLLNILNTGSLFGRLVPAYAAGVFGPMNIQIVFGVLNRDSFLLSASDQEHTRRHCLQCSVRLHLWPFCFSAYRHHQQRHK
jgi:predicted MFS family arabinose efflux permease